MVALEGYRGDKNFFVKYRLGDRILYAGSDWRDRLELIDGPAPANYATPSLVPMQYHQETPWESLPLEAISIPILGIDQWQLLRDRMLRSVVPADGTGMVVDFEYAEYFLFYDRAGQFQAMRLLDKPPDYPVGERLHFVEFMRRGRPILEAFPAGKGNHAHRVRVQYRGYRFVLASLPLHQHRAPPAGVCQERTAAAAHRNRGARIEKRPGLWPYVAKPPGKSRAASRIVALPPVLRGYRYHRRDRELRLGHRPEPTSRCPRLGDAPPMDLQEWETRLDKIASHPLSSGSVDVLVDGEAYFTRFIDTVSAAEKSVQLQTYIFDNDDYAVKIGELLKRRSNEGVEVKVLLDGFGTISGNNVGIRIITRGSLAARLGASIPGVGLAG